MSFKCKVVEMAAPLEEHVHPSGLLPELEQESDEGDYPDIELRSYQEKHYATITEVLEEYFTAVDTSSTGSGKTYMALKRCQEYKLELFVICTKSLMDNWTILAEKYGVKIKEIMTYQRLRGQSAIDNPNSISHNYLERSNGNYQATKWWQKICLQEKGILVVFDEFQNIRNMNLQSKASIALVQELYRNNYKLAPAQRNYVLFMSATPSNKTTSATDSFVQLLGFTNESHLYCRHEKYDILQDFTGLQEFISKCLQLDEECTKSCVDVNNLSQLQPRMVDNIVYQLFCKIVKPRLFSRAIKPPPTEHVHQVAHLFIKLSGADLQIHKNGREQLDRLKRSRFFAGKNQSGNNQALALLTNGQNLIEKSKITALAQRVDNILTDDDKAKVIIVLSYTENIINLARILHKYRPEIMHGPNTTTQRTLMNRDFQTDDDVRLLIGNIAVVGVGLDFHDLQGERSRYMYISSSYDSLSIRQASGRINRDGALSNSYAYIVHGYDGKENCIAAEAALLKNSMNRDQIMDTYGLAEQSEHLYICETDTGDCVIEPEFSFDQPAIQQRQFIETAQISNLPDMANILQNSLPSMEQRNEPLQISQVMDNQDNNIDDLYD